MGVMQTPMVTLDLPLMVERIRGQLVILDIADLQVLHALQEQRDLLRVHHGQVIRTRVLQLSLQELRDLLIRDLQEQLSQEVLLDQLKGIREVHTISREALRSQVIANRTIPNLGLLIINLIHHDQVIVNHQGTTIRVEVEEAVPGQNRAEVDQVLVEVDQDLVAEEGN